GLLIFGLHVHVGIPDREARVEVMNEARYFLPHLLAISTSSPFWLARNTGLKSYRQVIWGRFPRTGIPPQFSSYDEYENFVEVLDRKSTRLNSSHRTISYAVFCLKKKNKTYHASSRLAI